MHRTNCSIADRMLRIAHSGIMNSLFNADFLQLLEAEGFTHAMLIEGKDIYEEASLWVGTEIGSEDEIQMAQEHIQTLTNQLSDQYLSFAAIARKCFGRDSLSLLGIHIRHSLSKNMGYENAKIVFNRLQQFPELTRHLVKNGLNNEWITAVCDMLVKYETNDENLTNAKKAAAYANRQRETSLTTLRKWLAAFCEAALNIPSAKLCCLEQLNIDIHDLYAYAKPSQLRCENAA